MSTLNLGILAHVDAGKTSLTERLLYAAGVIDAIGSVDDGSTQTDTLALERQRAITIKTAVVSFAAGGRTVNLIDTPGHPDFIAEVERVLGVLDGAVLVVSAVEGVQAQTRVLMRVLRRLRIPVLLFVNKIDRRGADPARVLAAIAGSLTGAAVAMGAVRSPGTPGAAFAGYGPGDPAFTAALHERLAEHDDELLAAYVDGTRPPFRRLRRALAAQVRAGLAHPVYFGSAITGAGTGALADALAGLLPASGGDPGGPAAGRVFKIERGPAGEKLAYVRMFTGTIAVRDRVRFGAGGDGPGPAARVTGVSVFDRGPARPAPAVRAGQIGLLRGLAAVRIGDTVQSAAGGGVPGGQGSGPGGDRAGAGRAVNGTGPQFAPPALETVVTPRDPAGRGALRAALAQLAEQDPLIGVRQDDVRREVTVLLYGEVQQQVIAATLAQDFGIEVSFAVPATICVERPAGSGSAAEFIGTPPNPFLATVGLRVDPAPAGSGVRCGLEIEPGALPRAFRTAIEETVRGTLAQGLHGWQVTDCAVTLVRSGYWPRQSHAHGTFDASMSSTAGDFRNLTPLVLMDALRRAGTVVLEPVHSYRLEAPAGAVSGLLPVLAGLRAAAGPPEPRGQTSVLRGQIRAALVPRLRRRLSGLTRGVGDLEVAFSHYQPVRPDRGQVPQRPRTGRSPLNREEYLLSTARGRDVSPGPRLGGRA